MFLSCTTEKREVSSTNNLGLEDKSSNKSLIYIKENSWPRIDPWGTPAFISSHFFYDRLFTTKSTKRISDNLFRFTEIERYYSYYIVDILLYWVTNASATAMFSYVS